MLCVVVCCVCEREKESVVLLVKNELEGQVCVCEREREAEQPVRSLSSFLCCRIRRSLDDVVVASADGRTRRKRRRTSGNW